jgi:hypothetical protein
MKNKERLEMETAGKAEDSLMMKGRAEEVEDSSMVQGRVEIDERTFIREQDRLSREKRHKKNRRKRMTVGFVLTIIAALGIWYGVWGRKLMSSEGEIQVKVAAEPSQSVIYARLDSIYGNDITYTVANPLSNESQTQQASEKADTQGFANMPEGLTGEGSGSMPEGFSGEGTRSMPEGFSGEGTGSMPEGFGGEGTGSMPEGFGGEGNGSMPEGFTGESSGNMRNRTWSSSSSAAQAAFTYDDISYVLTEETGEDRIPVGTKVTTRLGTVSTFSRLRAGDYIALVMDQEDNGQEIYAIYVIG